MNERALGYRMPGAMTMGNEPYTKADGRFQKGIGIEPDADLLRQKNKSPRRALYASPGAFAVAWQADLLLKREGQLWLIDRGIPLLDLIHNIYRVLGKKVANTFRNGAKPK